MSSISSSTGEDGKFTSEQVEKLSEKLGELFGDAEDGSNSAGAVRSFDLSSYNRI